MYQNGDAGTARPAPGEPERLGRFELLDKLASGGMGEIYLARLSGEGGFEKLIVLKLLLPALVADERFVAMFLDVARLTAQLSHPNVCEVYELGRVDQRYFIAMPYLRGVPFTRLIKGAPEGDRGRLVASLLAQACDGLHHAHELRDAAGEPLNLVHRDVSPSNLFVTVDGVVKVLDFGIAKARGVSSHTAKDEIKGKYAYMSPEQLRGETLDRRSDVFSLGIVGHELLAGRRLFKRGSDYLAAKAILEEPVPRLDGAPPELAKVIERALARAREQRFATMADMRAALDLALESLGGAMSTAQVGAAIEAAFASELAARDEQYEQATARLARRASHASGVSTNKLTPATVALRGSPVPGAPSSGALVDARARRSRSLFPVVVVATAAFAAAGWWLASRGEPTQTTGQKTATRGQPPGHEPATANPTVDAEPAAIAAGAFDAGRIRPLTAADAGEPIIVVPLPKPPGSPAKQVVSKPARRPARSTTRVNERAPARRAPGYLSIDSKPYAAIYIDGKPAGTTPLIRRPLPPGRYQVRAVTASGASRTFPIVIRSGKEAPPQQLRW